jgi:hypothetical protein
MDRFGRTTRQQPDDAQTQRRDPDDHHQADGHRVHLPAL